MNRAALLRRLSRVVLPLIDTPMPRAEFVRRLLLGARETLGCGDARLWLREDGAGRRYAADRRGFAWTDAPRPRAPHDGQVRMKLPMAGGHDGILELSARPEFDLEFRESAARMIGRALDYHRIHHALRERVKELTCVYAISQLAQDPRPTEILLREIAALLPPAWQYPEACAARIVIGKDVYATRGFRRCVAVQGAAIRGGGSVEVGYRARRPEHEEGPFLREERNLINAVAEQVSLLLERRQAQAEHARVLEQIRHADRLATIGQLVAGVAHEVNEPLGAILGFAQLARRSAGMPAQAARDLDRIVQMSLHIREVVRKLVRFARPAPPKVEPLDLNRLVLEALDLLEFRYAKGGIRVRRSLASGLPPVPADPVQLRQVFVNLAVNGIQAMPRGGTLTVRTARRGKFVSLSVRDTGVGMTGEIRRRLFSPFFSTKGEGTGLGLQIVQGIVAAHGGRIRVSSRPNRGSTFEVLLP